MVGHSFCNDKDCRNQRHREIRCHVNRESSTSRREPASDVRVHPGLAVLSEAEASVQSRNTPEIHREVYCVVERKNSDSECFHRSQTCADG